MTALVCELRLVGFGTERTEQADVEHDADAFGVTAASHDDARKCVALAAHLHRRQRQLALR